MGDERSKVESSSNGDCELKEDVALASKQMEDGVGNPVSDFPDLSSCIERRCEDLLLSLNVGKNLANN